MSTHRPVSWSAWALSLAALCASAPAAVQAAADAHPAAPAATPAPAAAPKAAAVPAAATVGHGATPAEAPAPVMKPKAAVDPMDHVREKLAERLGAAKPPEAKSGNLVRVVAKAEPAAAMHASPAAKPSAAALAAAEHRASKSPEGAPSAGHTPHWSYQGEGGPAQWGQLKGEFSKCGSGTRQSPIDIRGGIRVDMDPIQFQYRPTTFGVVDNGHTVQVNLGAGNTLEILGRRYDLVQFHFHRPSEERIDGRQFDMVAHLVHKDVEGRLAVVAVLLDRGSAHPLVQMVWNNLPLEKGEEAPSRAAIDLNHLLPEDKRYFTYMGSLTTPPCSEGVLWMVMAQPVSISQDQVAVFSRLYPMNARPIQSAAGRLIKQSN